MELKVFFLVLFPGAKFDIFFFFFFTKLDLCVWNSLGKHQANLESSAGSKQEDRRQVFMISARVTYGETEKGIKH